MSTDTKCLIDRAAAELKAAGAREIYVFGSAAKRTPAPIAADVGGRTGNLCVRLGGQGDE